MSIGADRNPGLWGKYNKYLNEYYNNPERPDSIQSWEDFSGISDVSRKNALNISKPQGNGVFDLPKDQWQTYFDWYGTGAKGVFTPGTQYGAPPTANANSPSALDNYGKQPPPSSNGAFADYIRGYYNSPAATRGPQKNFFEFTGTTPGSPQPNYNLPAYQEPNSNQPQTAVSGGTNTPTANPTQSQSSPSIASPSPGVQNQVTQPRRNRMLSGYPKRRSGYGFRQSGGIV